MAPRRHLFFYLCLLLLGQSGCNNTTGNPALQAETGVPSPTAQTLSPNPAAKKTQYPELDLFDGREQEAETSAPLEYKGFQIRRKTKKVLIEETTKPTELSYAQVLRKRKVLITLDGVAHPMGNETRFGLFAFLSPDSKQLLVQQDAWRSSRRPWSDRT